MGIIGSIVDFVKGELINVIEWQDQSQDTILHQYDCRGNAIKNGAQLTVRESQAAVFVNEGELGDIFQPGRYELTTNNIPVLTKLKSWKYGLDSPFKCEVYFVNTKTFTAQKWGTPNVFYVRDQDFGRVSLRAFGTYSFRVVDPGLFVQKVSGTKSNFRVGEIAEELRSLIINNLITAIGESKVSLLDLAANYRTLGEICMKNLNTSEYGLQFTQFLINSISLPEELQKKLDEGTGMNMLGDMNRYQQMSMADAMKTAAANGGNGGGGMEGMMGMMMMNNMMNQQQMMNQQMMNQGGYAQGYGQTTPPPMMSQYHVFVNGQQMGPFPIQMLQQMVAQGQMTGDTQVWKQGMANWAAANTVPELAGLFGGATPPPPPAPGA
ncbi:MAG: SPFH domain-containing protein [Bacteroidales bacterium]|jgi:membrane protease subunit (stomatin/prohibitin family)|nr:SPFH domain-containing protein [Bacteroidales bacterium]